MVEFGEGNHFSLNKKIKLAKHPKMPGNGLFATEKIEAGEIVWKDHTEYALVDFDTLKTWPKEKYDEFVHFAYQVKENALLGPVYKDGKLTQEDDASNYMNHCCDGNAWYVDFNTMTARIDIEEGDEVTYDYVLSEMNPTKGIDQCCCGAKCCRGKYTENDWKRKSLQEKYKDHFVPYLNEIIKKL